jgi:hypothetical protein
MECGAFYRLQPKTQNACEFKRQQKENLVRSCNMLLLIFVPSNCYKMEGEPLGGSFLTNYSGAFPPLKNDLPGLQIQDWVKGEGPRMADFTDFFAMFCCIVLKNPVNFPFLKKEFLEFIGTMLSQTFICGQLGKRALPTELSKSA